MPTIDLDVERARHVFGGLRLTIGQYTGPASYVAGGDPIAPGDVGLGDIEDLTFEPPIDATPACRLITYDHANGKAIWFDMAGTEIAGAVDLSTFSARFKALGK